jgi:hypothetical protein
MVVIRHITSALSIRAIVGVTMPCQDIGRADGHREPDASRPLPSQIIDSRGWLALAMSE